MTPPEWLERRYRVVVRRPRRFHEDGRAFEIDAYDVLAEAPRLAGAERAIELLSAEEGIEPERLGIVDGLLRRFVRPAA